MSITSVESKSVAWHFSEEEMSKIPSLRDGLTPPKELKLRQVAAGFIHDMGERLNQGIKDPRGKISQLCMCAAMLHMHRFFVIHSFRIFDPRDVASACLFLAGKCEECPRKLEHIVKVWYMMKHDGSQIPHEEYDECADYIRLLEGVILQTIGFDLQVEVPHSIVLKAMNKIAPNNNKLTETAYWFATDILHMTDWCVRYKVRTLACVCIHLALSWADYEIPLNQKGEKWYVNFDPEMNEAKLQGLAQAFTDIYKNCGEQLAIKRFANKNGLRQAPKPIHETASNQSTATSRLPPPPPAPILLNNNNEPKQKKVCLSEYKEKYRQNVEVNERPIDLLSNERKSFIPDFSNPANLEMKEITLPMGIQVTAGTSKSTPTNVKPEKVDALEVKTDIKPSTSHNAEVHRESKKRPAEQSVNSPKRKPHEYDISKDFRRDREKERKGKPKDYRDRKNKEETSNRQDPVFSKTETKYERIERLEKFDKQERSYRRMEGKKLEHESRHDMRNHSYNQSVLPPIPILPIPTLPGYQQTILHHHPPLEFNPRFIPPPPIHDSHYPSNYPLCQQQYNSRFAPPPPPDYHMPPPPPEGEDLEEGELL